MIEGIFGISERTMSVFNVYIMTCADVPFDQHIFSSCERMSSATVALRIDSERTESGGSSEAAAHE